MDVSELGEFGLIRRLLSAMPLESDDVVVGPGDDAAVWRVGKQPPSYVIATTDTLVEGVHFLPGLTPWADVGYKALAVNVSDIFAMGGEPGYALVTLGLPPEMEVAAVDALYEGLRGGAFGSSIVGGDIVRSDRFFITVALFGEAQVANGEPCLLRRDRAQAGDAIAVTGTVGDSAAGLRLLSGGESREHPLVRAHLRPSPPGPAAATAVRAGVRCGTDVSDGLLQDIGHLCEMSGTGAVLRAEEIPISEALRAEFPEEALGLACTGGEDYQLVLAGPRHLLLKVQALLEIPLTVIGEMVEDDRRRVRLVDASGNEVEFGAGGWDHLRAAPAKPGA